MGRFKEKMLHDVSATDAKRPPSLKQARSDRYRELQLLDHVSAFCNIAITLCGPEK